VALSGRLEAIPGILPALHDVEIVIIGYARLRRRQVLLASPPVGRQQYNAGRRGPIEGGDGMRLVYLCFVSNGFDDHFLRLVCCSASGKDILTGMVRDYWRAAMGLQDAVGPYVLALDLDTMKAKPLGRFQLSKDGKVFAQIARGEFSGKPETAETLEERARRVMIE